MNVEQWTLTSFKPCLPSTGRLNKLDSDHMRQCGSLSNTMSFVVIPNYCRLFNSSHDVIFTPDECGQFSPRCPIRMLLFDHCQLSVICSVMFLTVRLYLDFSLCKASDRSKMVIFLASLGCIGILVKVCGLCDLGGPGPI